MSMLNDETGMFEHESERIVCALVLVLVCGRQVTLWKLYGGCEAAEFNLSDALFTAFSSLYLCAMYLSL